MEMPPLTQRERASVGIVWILAVIGAVLIGVLAGSERRLAWVSIAMLMLVMIASLIQLIIAKPAGFIHRMALSLGGAALVLAIATVVFMLTGASGFVT